MTTVPGVFLLLYYVWLYKGHTSEFNLLRIRAQARQGDEGDVAGSSQKITQENSRGFQVREASARALKFWQQKHLLYETAF